MIGRLIVRKDRETGRWTAWKRYPNMGLDMPLVTVDTWGEACDFLAFRRSVLVMAGAA